MEAHPEETDGAILKARHLVKQYGRTRAVHDLSLTIYPGDIYGFIGPNGAGKTTTFRILATILKPDFGTVLTDGINIRQGERVRRIIGYMPDVFGVYEDMTVFQYLDFFGAAYYLPVERRARLIADILELTDLAFKRDDMVSSLSRGMQQRLGIARVLIHDPKLLILDEPASGLDPRARVELRELLRELSGMGKTILISSHILSELSEICNRVGIIEQGRLVFEGSRESLNEKLAGRRPIAIETLPEDTDTALRVLQAAPFTNRAERNGDRIELTLQPEFRELHEVIALLVGSGCRVRAFTPQEISLEEAFMSLTRGKLA